MRVSRRYIWLSALLVCGVLAWSILPSSATVVDSLGSSDIKVRGQTSLQQIHSIGVVLGTVHGNDCLQNGVTVPGWPPVDHRSAKSDDVNDQALALGSVSIHPRVTPLTVLVASALQARGIRSASMAAGPLQTGGASYVPSGVILEEDLCHPPSSTLNRSEDRSWDGTLYNATPALTRAMASLPFDAVLVVKVDTTAATPWHDGSLLFGTVSPAHAIVELSAKLIAKDGSVPWAAHVGATGHLKHPGLNLPLTGDSGPSPRIEPVRDAAVQRLVALLQ